MYTKEDAETHQKIMKAIHKDVKRPRTWSEFRELQKQVQSSRVKQFDQASQNMQTDWESAFISSLYALQLKIILIVNHGATKRLKMAAKQVLTQLNAVIDKIIDQCEAAIKARRTFILNVPQQRYWLGRLKSAFKNK